MAEPLRFVPPRVPFLDSRTGLITREWYLFLQGMFIRVGGATGEGSEDFSQDMPADDGTEELKSEVYAYIDAIRQEQMSQRDMLAEIMKILEGLQQGPTI